jgi:hypothetical protein
MGREVGIFVDACAEQPLQRLGSSGCGDGRLMRSHLGSGRERPPVAANETFLDATSLTRPINSPGRSPDGSSR